VGRPQRLKEVGSELGSPSLVLVASCESICFLAAMASDVLFWEAYLH
jgi:hypothetical protein